MRLFETLHEAVLEVRRDVAKATPTKSSRVQQFTDLDLEGHEALGYSYAIMGGFPETVDDLLIFGSQHNFPLFSGETNLPMMRNWLYTELFCRLKPAEALAHVLPSEVEHPALQMTLEGNWPSYTYTERLLGAADALAAAINKDPDTRRAYWPIYRPEDALRSMAPTRVPCSIAYQVMVRRVGPENKLLLFYIERSADFDKFWLTDLWLARKFQEQIAERTGFPCGHLIHYVVSLHSFSNMEIY